MASAAISGNSSSPNSYQPFDFDTSLKVLAESYELKAVPSKFSYPNDPTALPCHSLPFPTVDFSALDAADPDQRSKAIHDLAQACREWGCFILVNHGMSERLIDATFAAATEFFSLPDCEKKQYDAKSASDSIKCGNLKFVNSDSKQSFTLWRDYLSLLVHPEFHCPHQPPHLREIVKEYSEKSMEIAHRVMKALCQGIELEEECVNQVLKMDSGAQIFAVNYYPPCPQPDQAIGIPSHTDPGLLNFLTHNGVLGLQVEHGGQWFQVESPKTSIFVNVSDQLEIFSNGRYKSVSHRAVVNKESTRISILTAHGPSREVSVGPAAALVEKDGGAAYASMVYKDYVATKVFAGKPNLLQCLKF